MHNDERDNNYILTELEVLSEHIDQIVNKKYLIDINFRNVEPLNEEEKSFRKIRIFKINKFVYDKQENVNDKLISIYSALQNCNTTTAIILKSDIKGIDFYIGVHNYDDIVRSQGVFEKSLSGNFPGSIAELLKSNAECEQLMNDICYCEGAEKNIASVSIIPSYRDKDKEKFVQGIEKFIDTMKGQEYTAILLAEPLTKECLNIRKNGLEELYSSLSPYAKINLTYGKNYSDAVSRGNFSNISQSVNNSITNTTSRNKGTSVTETEGTSQGGNFNLGGFGFNYGKNRSTSKGYSQSEGWSNAVTSGTSKGVTEGVSITDTITIGNTRTLAREHQNKSIMSIMETVDLNIKRYKSCESFGIWECAAYFVSTDISVASVAANTYKALMQGEESYVEGSYINLWDFASINTPRVMEYLKYLSHPVLYVNGYNNQNISVTPTSIVSGKELPLFMGFPKKSVAGLSVFNIAEFGRNVYINNHINDFNYGTDLSIGVINHMGLNEEHSDVSLNKDNLTAHCLITGATGSGKSYTTFLLIEKLMQNNIPFLVIEPAKGEYKDVFGKVENINIFTTNPLIGQMLKINPFKFDTRIHILEHLDRLIEIFKACWEMYAAMPAILKDAIEKIYIKAGWDLLNSVYIGDDEIKFPTFNDLMTELPLIIDSSRYSADTKGDYVGALVTRVASLTNGFFGQIFCDCYDIDDNVLFDQNTIIDLSRVGSSETKSLIMGLLMIRLNEYRIVTSTINNAKLKHITVLEEAHNLLKRSNPSQDGSNVVAKSVEMICNSIAEMRTYGEGFFIVDQSPLTLDPAAIKNTNTKIIMRLLEKDDCETAGKSIGLNEDQIRELSKFNTGIAAVMQNNWQEAVLAKIHRFSNAYYSKLIEDNHYKLTEVKGEILLELYNQYIEDDYDREKIYAIIESQNISIHKKREYKKYFIENLFYKANDDYLNDVILSISGIKGLLITFREYLTQLLVRPMDDEEIKIIMTSWYSCIQNNLKLFIDLVEVFIDNFDTEMYEIGNCKELDFIILRCIKALVKSNENENKVYKIVINYMEESK